MWTPRVINIDRISRNSASNKKHFGKQSDDGHMRHVYYHSKRKSFTKILKLNLHASELSSSIGKRNKDHYIIDHWNMEKQLDHRTTWNYELNHRVNKLLKR